MLQKFKAHVKHSSGFLDDQQTAKASVSLSLSLNLSEVWPLSLSKTYRSAMHLTQQDQKLDIVLRNQGATDSTFEVSAKKCSK